jgi:hypothetical protein
MMGVRDREGAVPVLLRRCRGRCLGLRPSARSKDNPAHISFRFLAFLNFGKQKTKTKFLGFSFPLAHPLLATRARLHDEHATKNNKQNERNIT